MLNSYTVLHTAHQLLYAHGTAAYEEEGNGVSLDVCRQSRLFGGKVSCLYSKHEAFHQHSNDNKTTLPQNIYICIISQTNKLFIKLLQLKDN
jgi:hypothetical protein